MELFSTFVTVPFLSHLTGEPPDLSEFQTTVRNLKLLLFWLVLNWTLAAFGEELAFRGYLMPRLAGLGRNTPRAWLTSLLTRQRPFRLGTRRPRPHRNATRGVRGLPAGPSLPRQRPQLGPTHRGPRKSNTLAFVLIYFDQYPGV